MSAAAGKSRQGAAEVEPGHLAAGDHRNALGLAEEREEQRQLEQLETAAHQWRELVDVGAELECDHPDAMTAQAMDLERLGHAMQHPDVGFVELPAGEASHRRQIRSHPQQPSRGLQVTRSRCRIRQ